MSSLDGELPTTLPELTMENIQSSESGKVENTTPHRNHLGDFTCRTGALICGGDKPHVLFCSANGWGRLYLTDTQIAAFVEDGSGYIANLVRNSGK